MTDRPEGREPRPEPHDAVARPLPKGPDTTLRTAMFVYAAVNGVSGLLLLAFPRLVFDTIAGSADLYAVAYDSMRLAGGPLVALAVAALVVMRDPTGRNTLVTVIVLEAVLVAVGGWWNLLADDPPTNLWFEVAVPVASTVLAGYVAWARVAARRILRA
ncbi:MAG: hypothetical protein R3290_12110 [Acidimicrobiia bacterium]|nr:hypothetical protein [Acidimicrobiia bacterium]